MYRNHSILSEIGKRAMDLLIAIPLFLILLPLMLVIATAIQIDSRGPVFWYSTRTGKNGKSFKLYWFRTMTEDSCGQKELTRVGRLIRDVSLDHLPFLINILRGDMSLVGPRPPESHYVDLDDPRWQEILQVRPGLISLAIIELTRDYNRSSWEARNTIEARYVRNRSIWYDSKLILRALIAQIRSRGNIKARG